MIESLGKLLLDPLAGRWKGVAVGGSLAVWLLLGSIVLLTRDEGATPRTWPVDCRHRPGQGRPLWCAVADGPGAAVPLVVLIAATVIGTAFLSLTLAPLVLRVAQAEGWGAWPLLSALPKRWHESRRRKRSRVYPTAVFPGGLKATRVANRLAALSERVDRRFGLDIGVAWDVLVCVVPPEVRAQFVEKSQVALHNCQHVVLCLLATTGSVLLLPHWGWRVAALLAGLVMMFVLWCRLAATIDEYCDMVVTTLLLHHAGLYSALRLREPGLTDDVPRRGRELSELMRKFVD
ncbi:hypothetical protein [Actinomadura luteofluorescens]|uniref:hypothetical protein n=1 Tax=Actinomadura luteofluorescens TaxID=46163 RepID=UPI0030CB1437